MYDYSRYVATLSITTMIKNNKRYNYVPPLLLYFHKPVDYEAPSTLGATILKLNFTDIAFHKFFMQANTSQVTTNSC